MIVGFLLIAPFPPPPPKVGVAVLLIPVPCARCLVEMGHEDVLTLMLAPLARLEIYFLNPRVAVLDEARSVPSTSSYRIVQHMRSAGSARIYLDSRVRTCIQSICVFYCCLVLFFFLTWVPLAHVQPSRAPYYHNTLDFPGFRKQRHTYRPTYIHMHTTPPLVQSLVAGAPFRPKYRRLAINDLRTFVRGRRPPPYLSVCLCQIKGPICVAHHQSVMYLCHEADDGSIRR